MRRVLRCDGLLPMALPPGEQARQAAPDDIRAMKAYVDNHRTLQTPFDIVVEGTTTGDDAAQDAAKVQPYIAAGATWWIEALWNEPRDEEGLKNVRKRLGQGPPRARPG